MPKPKVVVWRYGERYEFEFDTTEQAEYFFENTDDCFVEYLIDENGNIVKDNKENVAF